MKHVFSAPRALLSAAAALLFLAGLSARATNCIWTNTTGGNWGNLNNWSPNQVPGTADTADITAAGNYSVSLNVSPTVAGLILGASSSGTTQTLFTAGQTLTVNGPIQVSSQGQFKLNGGALAGTNVLAGTLSWSGGSLAGALTVASNSFLNIELGGGNGDLNGLLLTNYGTVNWTNTTLRGVNGRNAVIYNYGVWNAQSDNTFQGTQGGGAASVFDNFGTLLKSGGGGSATVLDANVVFNNAGTVNVQSGTLGMHGGGTGSGGDTFITAGGGNINIYGYTFNNDTTFTGPGTYMAGGQANFAGTIVGTLNWSGGSLAGTATLTSNSVINLVAGGGNDDLNGLVLTNYGTINWTNTTLRGVNAHNAQIYNYGLWNAQSDNTFQGTQGGGAASVFDNFGTFLKSGNTGTTTLDGNVVFNNSGTVDVESGTLNLDDGMSGGGGFTTASGKTINLSNYTFTNSTTFTGSGSYVAGNATFAGMIVGTLNWGGGSLNGTLTVASNSFFNIGLGGGNGDFNGLALTNYGTVNWTNTTLRGVNARNAAIYNYGLWNAQSDNTFQGAQGGGAASVFDNFGTFLKSGNTGTTTLDSGVVFNNTGTVGVTSGTLSINGGGVNSGSGTFSTANGGLLSLFGLTFANDATISSSTVVVLGGSTTINGVLTATNLQLVSGTLGGTNAIVGRLTWSGGSLAGVMTLASSSVLNIVAGGGNDDFNGLTLTNYGTVNWTNTTLRGVNGHNAVIYNYGVWNAQSDNTFQGAQGGGAASVFDNFGTLLKSGGGGSATVLDANVVFNNAGTVNVQSGTLGMHGGGTGSGGDTFITAGGGNINIYGYTFNNDTTFTGPGTYMAGGQANFAGTIVGTLNWSGGSLAGTATLTSNSVINLVAGGGNDDLNGLVLTNYGTINWTNTTLRGVNAHNAQIYNYGLWNAQSDNTFQGTQGGGAASVFDNFGTFLKSGNTGTTTLDDNVVFNNSGTVDVESGTLNLDDGMSGGGGFTTASGKTINLSNYTFTNSTTFTGSGSYVAGNATFAGMIVGTLNWGGGSLNGTLTVASNSFFNIGLGGGNGDFNGLALTNYGTVNWTNTTLRGVNARNAAIYNYGLWNAQSDNTFQGAQGGGAASVFDNFGTFLKSGNTGTTTLDSGVVFNNTGTMDVESGTLRLNGSYSLATAHFVFGINSATNYGILSLAGAAALSGSVGVNFNNGFLPAAGNQFPVLSCASLTGTFSPANLPFGGSFTYSSTTATLVWNGMTQANWAAGGSALHGTSTVTFLVSPGMTVQLVASAGGVSHPLGTTTASGLNTISFNTGQLADGLYSLQAIIYNGAGQVVGQFTRTVFVNNSLAWHEGTLSANQTWGTNVVSAVDENVIIPSGVTLTLAPGAVVKFAKGTGIIIQSGGILEASGATAAAPTILTSVADDTVGGDSNEDGNSSIPLVGDWNGVAASGQFNVSTYVQIRYVIQAHSGILAGNQEWFGSVEHLITGNLAVPTNVTLTIDAGAIVKVALGVKVTVQAGGQLIAAGTVAQPIVFTSIHDTSVGANTNTVVTTPAAGDWDSIYLNGGRATFDHVTISYGGGPDSLNSGLISLTAAGAVATVLDSILSQGFYKGINAEYGTVNVTNCLVTGCDRGIQSGLSGPTLVNVMNCTLDANNYGLFAHGGTMNVANTIVANSLTAGIAYCCGSFLTLFEHNDVWSSAGVNYSGSSDQTGINGNISANPKFVNATQGNYELDYGSPAIDAADGTLATLTDLAGAPRYNDPRTLIKTGLTNASGVYSDLGAFEFVETANSPVDLIVTSVAGPLSETTGQTATVQWNDVNIGSENATGPWHDTLLLVPQNGGEPLVVGTVLVAQNVVLGSGQSYSASASVVVPGGRAGGYQWQVHVNSQGDVFEGVNWTNNFGLAAASSMLTDPTITIGGTFLTNVFTSVGQSRVFALVSSGGPFVVNAQGDTPGCALELFVGDGYVPDPSHYDFRSSQFNSPTVSLTVPSNDNDTYYVVVYAVSLNAATVSYTLSASQLGFELNSVNPGSMANSGPVTLQILGAQLAANDTYTLAGPGGVFGASFVQSPDPTVAYATFDLSGAVAGLYDLQVGQPSGPTLTLTNAISATSLTNVGAAASISIQLELPAAYRQSRPFDGTIVYRNAGEIDMPAPLLILSSGGVSGMAVQGSTNFPTSDLVLVGASFEGPAGTLSPGKSGSIGFVAFCASGATIPFAVKYKTADASDLIYYSTLELSLRPPGYCDSSWSAIWASFQTSAGPTWGGFVRLVDFYSTRMALSNAPGKFYLLRDVLAFAFADLANVACTNGLSLSPPVVPTPPDPHSGPGQLVPNRHSADPNDKFATGIGLPEWVGASGAITYSIEFQNQTNASAPAQSVTIIDALATNLNWSTLQLKAIAFNDVNLEIPPHVQNFTANVFVGTDPNPVAVRAALDPATGVLTWVMESIDPVTEELVTDPLAGFLPPDNVSSQGEGYVTFSVEPKRGLVTGAQITNQASIIFDNNAAIATPITTNTMDVTPPTSSIAPLPPYSNTAIPVSWSGSDEGSGITSFDVYVSTNGGAWIPWLLTTTNTSAHFSGDYSNTYAFYSVAYDAVGNVEADPIIPGATTIVPVVTLKISPSATGSLTLNWPQGTLLQSTDLNGPWTTNTAASPYTFSPTNPRMYFKVLVQ